MLDIKNDNLWTGRFTFAGVATSTVGGWIMLKGVLQIHGELSVALPVTISCSIIAFLLFAFLCDQMPNRPPEKQGKLVLGVALPGLGIVAMTCTSIGILGIAAPEAQRRDLIETVDRADARLEHLLKQHRRQSEAVVILEGRAKEFDVVAEQEKERGHIERKGESGKAYRDLMAVSEGFAASAGLLRADQKRREEAGQAAAEALTKLRELAESTQANVESLRRIAEPAKEHLRAVSVSLAELERSVLDGDVLAPVDATLGQQELIPVRSGGNASEEAQERRQAAAGIVAQLGSQSHQQTAEALNLLRAEPAAAEHFTLLDPAEAVIEHFWSVAYLVALPVALDLAFPIVSLIALSLLQVNSRNGRGFSPVEQHHETSQPWPQLDRSVAASREQRSLGHGRGGKSGPH